MALVSSQDSGLPHSENSFKAPQSRTQPNRTQRNEMIAMLSPSLPPPPPPPLSTCLCARLLLIFEALSFVFVRCPKDYGMKRDR